MADLSDLTRLPPQDQSVAVPELKVGNTPLNTNLDFVQRYLYPSKYPIVDNGDGSYSTHRMASGETDGKFIAYPTIVRDPGTNQLRQLNDQDAARYAIKSGEYMQFPTDAEANAYADNGYKIHLGAGDKADYQKALASGDKAKASKIKAAAEANRFDTRGW